MFENFRLFFREQKANILVTILGGLVPLFVGGIISAFDSEKPTKAIAKSICDEDFWKITPRENFVLQSIFILITLYVLIQVRKFVIGDLESSEEQIKQYIKKNCGLKIFDHNSTINSAFQTVQGTVSQFFYAWLAVWLMWLIYYGGGLFFSSLGTDTKYGGFFWLTATFQHLFDFLNSTALFAIYIILTSVTVNRKKRTDNDNSIMESVLVWVVLFIVFMAGIIIENFDHNHLMAEIMPFYVSTISTVTFVLVLGKMNSTYLQIPPFFMFVLYLYALIQLYIPFKDLYVFGNCWFNTFIDNVLPYLTLLGKFILMLTICWIAVRRRFLFFVIHRSTTIDRTDELLSELNKENVSF